MTAFSVTLQWDRHWLIVSGTQSRYYPATSGSEASGGVEEIRSVSLMRGEKSRRLRDISKFTDDYKFIRSVFGALEEQGK